MLYLVSPEDSHSGPRQFVLMQYFGCLRRNPNDPQDTDYTGYDFWLTKLNQFNGNFLMRGWSKPSLPRLNTGNALDREANDRLWF